MRSLLDRIPIFRENNFQEEEGEEEETCDSNFVMNILNRTGILANEMSFSRIKNSSILGAPTCKLKCREEH